MQTVKPTFYSLISILFLADHVAMSVKLSRQNDTESRKVCAKCRMTPINLWANSTDTHCKAKCLPINSHEHQFPANSMPAPSAPTSNRHSPLLLHFPIAVISPIDGIDRSARSKRSQRSAEAAAAAEWMRAEDRGDAALGQRCLAMSPRHARPHAAANTPGGEGFRQQSER